MSDSKENKKKGFFSRLFGGSSAPEEPKKEEIRTEDTREIPTKSALNKMKKADIVAVAKENGLELDINLTKAKLLDAWDIHFNDSPSPSAVDDAATVMAESAASQKESIDEDVPAEEAAPEEESPADEAAPEEDRVHLRTQRRPRLPAACGGGSQLRARAHPRLRAAAGLPVPLPRGWSAFGRAHR